MPFKFEQLEIWRLALEYIDLIYDIADELPRREGYNLKSQIRRAATSVALNIAEGSTGQTNAEHGQGLPSRFLGLAIRSLLKTVACQHLISRRGYLQNSEPLRDLYRKSETLVAKLHTMRKRISPDKPWIRESVTPYVAGDDNELPF